MSQEFFCRKAHKCASHTRKLLNAHQTDPFVKGLNFLRIVVEFLPRIVKSIEGEKTLGNTFVSYNFIDSSILIGSYVHVTFHASQRVTLETLEN